MAIVNGQGTTFNLPNFVGELFAITPTETPFLECYRRFNRRTQN